ncbi:MAG: leucyl aminopeptidase [Burkholderiales bacterium]|nr:MAG: leucyl aminopeptidase [Burkholderiales bacterium]
MDFELKTLTLSGAAAEKADALIVLVPQSFKPGKGVLETLLAGALKSGDFEAKPGKLLQLWRAPDVAAARSVLAGTGDGSARQVRQAVLAAIGALKATPAKRITICFAQAATADALRCAVLAAAEASYVYTTTKPKAEARKISLVTLGVPAAAGLTDAFGQAKATVAGIEFTKEWANRPGNHCTPTMLGEAARTMAKASKVIQCEVLGPKEVAKLGMGSFISVAQGSYEPLRFIVLRYDGVKGKAAPAPTVLVGKGITFDTGGISIKPAAEMDEMKFDMCGAASVLGVFRALADLKPAINVVGLIPSCENMPSGRSVKPGDVVTSMSGQTIENLNTDAEGRLILCDALTYAERFKPAAVIDVATLTGACVVALGGVRHGLFASDEALAKGLFAAGESSLDPCWRMPLDDEYGEGLKSNFADMANVAGRAGGAVTAAKFLQRFTAKFPWAHLDIAGTAWKGGAAKGATGRPVGLLLTYLLAQAGTVAPQAAAAARASTAAKAVKAR